LKPASLVDTIPLRSRSQTRTSDEHVEQRR
jgi:hypothetical protein